MIKRILFFTVEQFNKAHYEKLGIELLEKNGFQVEVWDLYSVVNKGFPRGDAQPEFSELRHCTRYADEKKALEDIRGLTEETFVISFIGFYYQSYPVYKALSDSRAQYGLYLAGTIPLAIKTKKDFIFNYLKKFSKLQKKKLFSKTLPMNFLFRRLYYLWPKLRPARLLLAGGSKYSESFFPNSDKTSEVLWGHNADYDVYLKEREIPYSASDTAVFMDGAAAHHPDDVYRGLKPPVSPDVYYPAVNRFLDKVEKETGLKVVIASHPRFEYERHPECYPNRECIRGQTGRLVKESKLVLSHGSTAVAYPVLFHKPMIILTSKEYERSHEGSSIRLMANCFNKEPLSVDYEGKIDWDKEMSIDEECYRRYKESYIKKEGSDDLPFWQIVANRLKKGF